MYIDVGLRINVYGEDNIVVDVFGVWSCWKVFGVKFGIYVGVYGVVLEVGICIR